MKRAITEQQGEKKPGYYKPNPDVKDYKPVTPAQELFIQAYNVFDDKEQLEKLLEKRRNMWDRYSPAAFHVKSFKDFTIQQKTSFEFYLCGWLQYYDQVVRNNRIDHTIHFKWTDQEVFIYIYPPPAKKMITGLPANRTSDPQSPKIPPPPNP